MNYPTKSASRASLTYGLGWVKTKAMGMQNTRRALLLTFSVLLALSATAAEHHPMRLIEPAGTQLVLHKLVRDPDLFAKYGGQAWVTGTVIARWTTGAMNLKEKQPEYLLIPDPVSAAQLPHFMLSAPPHLLRYNVNSILLINGVEALGLAAGEIQVRRLLERRVNHVRISGQFLIEGYVVGVECDAPWAKAVLVRAQLPEFAAQHQSVPKRC